MDTEVCEQRQSNDDGSYSALEATLQAYHDRWWQADPNDGPVLSYLSHNMVRLSQLAESIGLATWSAIATFRDLAYRTGFWS